MPEKSEWRLNGQMLTYTMPLSETIASLKSKIQDDVGMQPAKQKLHFDVSIFFIFVFYITNINGFQGMFFKDSNTLAYYNIIPGVVLQLQVKERGGRKK